MIIVGSRAAELRGIKFRRAPADIDLIGTPDEMDDFRRANVDMIKSERRRGPQRTHFLLRHPLYKKVEFGAEDFLSNDLLRALCATDKTSVLHSEAFLPTVNILGLTKRCHLNYPLNWDKHFRDYTVVVDYLTEVNSDERAYYLQCIIEVKQRYSRRSVDFQPALKEEVPFKVILPYREDVFKAIPWSRRGPICQLYGIDPRPGLISTKIFERLSAADKIRFVQELFIVLGIEERLKQGRDLNQYAVYRLGMRHALRDLYAGWFQDYCLDNLATLRFAPDDDFMAGYHDAERAGRIRWAAEPTRDAQAELARAVMLDEAGRGLEAEFGYRATLRDDPDNVVALRRLGVVLQRARHLEEAERLLRRVLVLEPQNWGAFSSLAFVLLRMGRLDEAASNYRRGIQINPRYVPARLGLGRVLAQAGRLDEAIQACREALRIAPQDKSAAEFLRRLYRSRNDPRSLMEA